MGIGRVISFGILIGLGTASAQAPLAIRDQLKSIEGEIAECLARIEHGQTRSAQIQSEVDGLEGRREAAQEQVVRRARVLYRVRRSGMLPVAGGFDALLQHLGRVNRLSRMVKSDLEQAAFLSNRAVALQQERSELATSVADAETVLSQLRRRKGSLQHERQSASLFRQALRSGAPEASRDQPTYGQVQVVDDWDQPESRFPDLRGRLALPVQGVQRIRNARREDGTGLEFVASPGTSVRCAADGRVAFSRRYGDYGRMLIIDHGDRYYTVYGGMGQVSVDVGDWVGMSARIGTVASDDPSALFFEVRRGTRSLDARNWLGL